MPCVVLLHSPFVGPATWRPVREQFAEEGHDVRLPSLVSAAAAASPLWSRVVDEVDGCLAGVAEDRPVVVVAHSNAGLFVPVLTARARHRVAGCVFVDALVPGDGGWESTMPPQAVEHLTGQATNGVLPPWTEWFDEDAVASLFPDEGTRAAVAAEQPRLPVSYCREQVPVPAEWDRRPCGYLQFSDVYAPQAGRVRQRGWLVRRLPGEHLHQLVDPAAVADQIVDIVSELLAASE